jgi:hypothetical protein
VIHDTRGCPKSPVKGDGSAVKESLTANPRSGRVANSDYQAMVGRILRAYGRRVASADPEALAELVALRDQLDTAIDAGVAGLRTAGYSWAAIGAPMGMSRQAAQQRWG